MQIFYKNLTGKTKILEVEPSDTIERIASMISQNEGIAIRHLWRNIIFAGQCLEFGKLYILCILFPKHWQDRCKKLRWLGM